jgi:putative pyruvate formate lyase activating enzyme
MGAAADTDSFGGICMALQERGAENINIVTGGHAAPALVLGIRAARSMGLSIPVLWNSSAYEGDLSILEDTVDIYLPDLKTLDGALAGRFFKAPDYPEYAERAILRMMETRPGQVIVRHLVLPDHLDSTREALRWFAGHSRGRARLSLMTQYTPVGAHVPGRYVSQGEYETVLGWLEEFDIGEGFYQELAPGDSWLPDFRRRNPFPPALSEPVWHWRTGFIRRGFEKVEKV